MATTEDVLRYLNAVDFPASKQEIIREAQRERAPKDVLTALRAMPPVDYRNKAEVAASAATEIAPELTPAEKAVKARDHRHQRIAEHLRQPSPET
jgi:Protein of unknown function (DUF2795)